MYLQCRGKGNTRVDGGQSTVLWCWFFLSISLPGFLGGIQVTVLAEPSGQPHFLFRKPNHTVPVIMKYVFVTRRTEEDRNA